MSDNKSKAAGSASKFVLFAIASVAVWIIVSQFYFRVDLTEDKAFSLSEGSLNIAAKVEEPVTARLYYSKSVSEVPVMIKQYGTRVEEVLKEFAAGSDGQMTVEFIDPRPDTDEEEWARKYGISGAQLPNGDEFYLGVVFLSAEKEQVIPYLDPRKEELLEYDLAEALVKLGSTKKPTIGVVSSLPVMGSGAPQMPGMPPQGGQEEWAVIGGLKNFFEVEEVKADAETLPESVTILILMHPKNLSEKLTYAIDQFLLKGGRLIVAVDPFSRIDRAMSGGGGMMGGRMAQASSDLPRLFKTWGIEYAPTKVVGDFARGTMIGVGGQRITYPFFMTMMPGDFDQESRMTSQLKQVLFAEGGSLAFKDPGGLKFTPLLQTDADSGTSEAMMASMIPPAEFAARFKPDGKKRTLAALLSGKFKSSFSKAPEGVAGGHVAEAAEENTIFLVADVDFLHDSNSVNKMRFGPQVIMSPRNDNLNLILNAAEYLGGSQDLLTIRSSGQLSRPFTRVMEIQKAAQARWQAEEDELSKKLQDLQSKLQDLQASRTDGNRLNLSASQAAEIRRFRDEEAAIRKRRREVRKNLREDIENLGHTLIAANMLILPLCISGFGVMVFRRRTNRARDEKNNG